MEKKDENNIKVIVPDEHQNDDQKEKKKNILLIVFGSVGATLITFFSIIAIIVIVITIIFVIGLSNLNKNNTTSSSDDTYVMDEYTENRYKNLYNYVNSEWRDIGHDANINYISTLSINDTHMSMMCFCDNEPIYVDINVKKNNVDEMLNIFKETTPKVGTFASTFQVEKLDETTTYNLDNYIVNSPINHVIVSDFGVNKYMSFLGIKDDDTIVSNTHTLFNNENIYDASVKVTKSNKLLFDMYWYILHPTY